MKRLVLPFLLVLAIVSQPIEAWPAEEYPVLRASASAKLLGSLVVGEKDLIKLDEIVRQRMAAKATPSVQYVVTYPNKVYYETSELRIVLNDENTSARPILSLTIAARAKLEGAADEGVTTRSKPRIDITLTSEGASYSISGADRDWVLATEVDIIERLNTLRGYAHWYKIVLTVIGAVAGFLAVFLPFAFRWRRRYDAGQSANDEKYTPVTLSDYIFRINDKSLPWEKERFLLIASSMTMAFTGGAVYTVAGYLFPDAVFLLGTEIERYATILSIRHYLLTSVVVTLVLGVAGGVIANLLTRRR
ncbi:hypothetical protein MELA_01661 [Candidatus Methylomirabilis lanthanidiphila]|uniref:Uncharacterized protein n=1 Tax=Candidatus Methylomirabilis lanthanidiphila TaxID=2211376 RepID=A0A564ZIW8_9BACT|nr:hypothetical protein [Candidatus Methylomirabilis lanthanidiphila]VUZ85279.1 hypothetical protein MELA_01661 [Candidatus Methylomirabilis lanthanidiphila]